MKQIPRYDPLSVDPLGLKPVLSNLFNSTLTDLYMASTVKDKIFVGNHNIECTGAIKEARYRHTKSGKYDGIHLYGSSGTKAQGSHHKKNGKIWEKFPNRLDPPPSEISDFFEFQTFLKIAELPLGSNWDIFEFQIFLIKVILQNN